MTRGRRGILSLLRLNGVGSPPTDQLPRPARRDQLGVIMPVPPDAIILDEEVFVDRIPRIVYDEVPYRVCAHTLASLDGAHAAALAHL